MPILYDKLEIQNERYLLSNLELCELEDKYGLQHYKCPLDPNDNSANDQMFVADSLRKIDDQRDAWRYLNRLFYDNFIGNSIATFRQKRNLWWKIHKLESGQYKDITDTTPNYGTLHFIEKTQEQREVTQQQYNTFRNSFHSSHMISPPPSRKSNPWITHVTNWAAEKKCTYNKAMIDPECKDAYFTNKQTLESLEERYRRLTQPEMIMDVVSPPPSPPPPPPPPPRPVYRPPPPPPPPPRPLYRPPIPPPHHPIAHTRGFQYKTIYCTRINQAKGCKFGAACDFAHSRAELQESWRMVVNDITKMETRLNMMLKQKARIEETLRN